MSTITLSAAAGATVLALGNHQSLNIFVSTLLHVRPDLKLLVVRDDEQERTALWPACPQVQEHFIRADDFAKLIDLVDMHAVRLGCVMAWSRRLPDSFIERFSGGLLNLHFGDLPRYRGAGGGSWQVLNDERAITAHIQQMHSEMDRGPLLLAETEPLASRPLPCDVKAASARAANRSVARLAQSIAEGQTLPLTPQDEDLALYFPRLTTVQNGWINFAWSAQAIERFIRAFSDPYPGAAFRCGGQIYRVRRARIRTGTIALHPFCAGLIVNRTKLSVDVAAHDGVLHFDEIVDEQGAQVELDRFPVGARFWSADADLSAALQFRPKLARRKKQT